MKVSIEVRGYDADSDEFILFIDMPDVPCGGGQEPVGSVAFACMVREWGEPQEFIGRTFNLDF